MTADKIKEACKLRGISIRTLSEKIGMSFTGLYKAMSNDTFRVNTLKKIANTLELPITFFFNDDNLNENNNIEKQKTDKEELQKAKKRIAELEKLIKIYDEQNKELTEFKLDIDEWVEKARKEMPGNISAKYFLKNIGKFTISNIYKSFLDILLQNYMKKIDKGMEEILEEREKKITKSKQLFPSKNQDKKK